MKLVHAYVDGASSNNQSKDRKGGWAAVLMLMDSELKRDERPDAYKELSGTVPGATNNQMELEAIRQVLKALKNPVAITVYSDSSYAIGVLSGENKARKNVELIQDIQDLMKPHQVSFAKVQGHAGIEYNERADTLAVAATKS